MKTIFAFFVVLFFGGCCMVVPPQDDGLLRYQMGMMRLAERSGIHLDLPPQPETIPCPGPEVFCPPAYQTDPRYPNIVLCLAMSYDWYEICCFTATTPAARAKCYSDYMELVDECIPDFSNPWDN